MHDGRVVLHQNDCRDVLRGLADNSIDSVVTDPPYALVSIQKRFGRPGSAPAKDVYGRGAAGFMGKTWDTGEVAFSEEFWAEVLRVLKPGGHVVAFSGTRTYHRMAVAIEDAGFEIRDQLGWVYGSGFPKSHNQHGDWEGWGTALKPAWEPIALARKPLVGTVAANLAEWGVGAINVNGCRVEWPDGKVPEIGMPEWGGPNKKSTAVTGQDGETVERVGPSQLGRWPANIIHDGSDEVLAAFPDTKSGMMKAGTVRAAQDVPGSVVYGVYGGDAAKADTYGDSGSAARFFYCAKASRADRDAGMSSFETRTVDVLAGHRSRRMEEVKRPDGATPATGKNTHPTVKPTTLMQWLCRLITPPGGVILDPFMGSGSTGKAAVLEGFQFIGCEREDEYMPIATARIAWVIGATSKDVAETVAVPANDNRPADLFSEAA
nr:site-specific DNA-methyltransferase [Agrobacterium burrii]